MSLELAHSVSHCVAKPCPELGVKPICRLHVQTSQFDPEPGQRSAARAAFRQGRRLERSAGRQWSRARQSWRECLGDRQGLRFGSLKRNLPSKHHVAFRQRRGRHEAEARDKNAVIRYFEHIGAGAISNAVKVCQWCRPRPRTIRKRQIYRAARAQARNVAKSWLCLPRSFRRRRTRTTTLAPENAPFAALGPANRENTPNRRPSEERTGSLQPPDRKL
jgi:hypothetical protein